MLDLTLFPELTVYQEMEHLEVFTGMEAANRYTIAAPDGAPLLYAYEESGFWRRQFQGTHRPLSLKVMDGDRNLVLRAWRKFFWFLPRLNLEDGQGSRIGALQRQCALIGRRMALEGPGGEALAEVRGPVFRPHTFFVHRNGAEVARVTKQWSGLAREAFSRADTFKLQFHDATLDNSLRALVLGAAFAIDLDFFENRQRRGPSGGFTFGGTPPIVGPRR